MQDDQTQPITEDWLMSVGFKWHQMDRQPQKHWVLWLGDAVNDGSAFASIDDIGLELSPAWWLNCSGERIAPAGDDRWHCWLRSDGAGRYHRFIHLRHLRTTLDVIGLVEAITGRPWAPENHLYGNVYSPDRAKHLRNEMDRIDMRMRAGRAKWSDIEKDDTRGRALPEHMDFHASQMAKREDDGDGR